MNAQMATMQKFHQKFQNAAPEELQALINEHRMLMQNGMQMMGTASGRANRMGRMGMGMGMMGGMGPAGANGPAIAPGAQMTPEVWQQHYELMSTRMDMMQSMMQIMIDRLDATETK